MSQASGAPEIVRLQLGPTGTNCYLLKSDAEIAIIDPGFEAERVLAGLKRLGGYGPGADARVVYIINTHGHIDHIGANAGLKRALGAPIVIGHADARLLTEAGLNLSLLFGIEVVSPAADRVLREGDVLEIGGLRLTVVETPGHTEGGICLLGDGLAFTGDTLFFDSMGRTDFPGGSEPRIFASLKRLVELIPDDAVIYPGHNEPGRMKDCKRVNPFLDFERGR
jgi:glyoxylase-like metal-dependent hydrolase (beta-lactamase superfamily II)